MQSADMERSTVTEVLNIAKDLQIAQLIVLVEEYWVQNVTVDDLQRVIKSCDFKEDTPLRRKVIRLIRENGDLLEDELFVQVLCTKPELAGIVMRS